MEMERYREPSWVVQRADALDVPIYVATRAADPRSGDQGMTGKCRAMACGAPGPRGSTLVCEEGRVRLNVGDSVILAKRDLVESPERDFVLAHELGHVVLGHTTTRFAGTCADRCMIEVDAWEWAIAHTPGRIGRHDEQAMVKGLGTYLQDETMAFDVMLGLLAKYGKLC